MMVDSCEKQTKIMELFIETLTGTVFELKVSPLDTVISIKTKIQRLEGIPVSQQHLIWRSEELDDKSSLEDHEIRDGATLKLVISMRGGPINTRRVPVEDPSWKEITEYMEANRDEIWDKLPGGRQVTLLVFRDGDQINFFRLVDRGDGTVAPVAETVSVSSMRNVCITEELETVDQRLRENNVTMQKMRSIRKQMDALTLKKKPRKRIGYNRLNATPVTRSIHPFRLPPVPRGHRVPLASQSSSVARSDAVISLSSRRSNQLVSQRERAAENRSSLSGAEAPLESTTTSPVVHLAVQSHGYRGMSDLRTMPTTVHGDGVLRVETSCSNSDNDELDSRWSQSSWSTSLVDSRENLTHSESRSGSSAARDGTVTLGVLAPTSELPTRRHLRGNSQQPTTSHTSIDNLEQLQQTLAKFDPRISVQASPRARLPRTTNIRSNLESIILGRMTLDKNGSAKNNSERDYRPKSSPEDNRKFLSLQNSFTRPIRPVRPQVLPVPPIGSVRMQTNNTSGATRKMGSELERSTMEMPNSSNKVTLTTMKQRFCPQSKGTVPLGSNSTAGNLKVLPLDASTGAINKTTAESSGLLDVSKDVVLKGSGLVTLPSVVIKTKKSHQRCLVCNRKTGLATSYSCRCGGNFCATHRYAETHDCTYDYKSEGRKILEQSNPLVTAQKLPKI